MPQPTISDQHIDRALTNISVAFIQREEKFAHKAVFPGIPVQNKSDDYFIFPRSYFLRQGMKKRGPGTAAPVVGYNVTTDSYTCEVWSECVQVADQIRSNVDAPLQPDRNAAQLLASHALIQREEQWVSSFFDTNIWTNEVAGAESADSTHVKYWSSTGSDPTDDILNGGIAMEQLTGYKPNVLTLGAKVKKALKVNAAIIDRLKYGQTGPGIVTVKDSDLAQLFEVDKVVVAAAIHTTSNEGASSDTYGYIAGNHAGLFYANPTPGLEMPSAGYIMNWAGFLGGNGEGVRIKRYRWEKTASDDTEIDSAYAMKKVSADLGYFFKDVIQ